jgi:hypothetical protein
LEGEYHASRKVIFDESSQILEVDNNAGSSVDSSTFHMDAGPWYFADATAEILQALVRSGVIHIREEFSINAKTHLVDLAHLPPKVNRRGLQRLTDKSLLVAYNDNWG